MYFTLKTSSQATADFREPWKLLNGCRVGFRRECQPEGFPEGLRRECQSESCRVGLRPECQPEDFPEGLRRECQPEAVFKLYCLKIAQVLAFRTPELALHVMITVSHAEQHLWWKES